MVDPDFINGFMEFASAGLMAINLRRIMIDKTVAGVSILPTIFFDLWGLWNLAYYWQLHQPISWYGGACLVTVNIAWTALAIHYSREEKCTLLTNQSSAKTAADESEELFALATRLSRTATLSTSPSSTSAEGLKPSSKLWFRPTRPSRDTTTKPSSTPSPGQA